MSHKSRRDADLQRFFDGELSPRQAREVYERVATNETDQVRLAALGQMRGALRDAAADRAQGVDLAAQVMARIQSEPKPHRGWQFVWQRWPRFAVGLAGAAAAILGVLWLNPGEVRAQRNDCVVESLQTGPQTIGTIFTIEDQELASATTVIWLSELVAGETDDEMPDNGQ